MNKQFASVTTEAKAAASIHKIKQYTWTGREFFSTTADYACTCIKNGFSHIEAFDLSHIKGSMFVHIREKSTPRYIQQLHRTSVMIIGQGQCYESMTIVCVLQPKVLVEKNIFSTGHHGVHWVAKI